KKVHTDTTTTSTSTITPHCTTSASPKQADATKQAAKVQPSSSSHADASPTPTKPAKQHNRRSAALSARLARRAALAKRDGPDGPLTTTITQTVTPAGVQTVLAPASTITETNMVEIVQTST